MKKTVENKQADIQQIQKYLNGELDARAMHKLERRAQDDPFLMDALEGYGVIKDDQRGSLAALQRQLEARTATKVRRMPTWVLTAIAAGVIGFAVVVGLLYNNNDGNKQAPQLASNEPVKTAPVNVAPVITDKPVEQVTTTNPQKQVIASNKHLPAGQFARVVTRRKLNANAPLQDSAPAQSVAVNAEPAISPLEEIVGSDMVADKRKDTVLGGGYVAINKNASQLTVLKSKAQGAGMTARPGKATENNPTALANAGLPPNLMAGAVIDRKDALPLSDALGRVPAKRVATTQANAYGYTMPGIKKDEVNAEVASFGSKSFKRNDSAAAQYKTSQILAEVAIADKDFTKTANVRPVAGWDNYKKYLQQNAVSPDGKEGTIQLKVTINANGSVAAVVITQSLSTAADAKAISIVKNGPAWIGSKLGKTEDVKVVVTFHQ